MPTLQRTAALMSVVLAMGTPVLLCAQPLMALDAASQDCCRKMPHCGGDPAMRDCCETVLRNPAPGLLQHSFVLSPQIAVSPVVTGEDIPSLIAPFAIFVEKHGHSPPEILSSSILRI